MKFKIKNKKLSLVLISMPKYRTSLVSDNKRVIKKTPIKEYFREYLEVIENLFSLIFDVYIIVNMMGLKDLNIYEAYLFSQRLDTAKNIYQYPIADLISKFFGKTK